MSASSRPTRRPCICSARARFVATVDLPTPPLPLATATTCLTPGRVIFSGIPGGGMTYFLSKFLAFRAFAQAPQVFEREQARVVAVAPSDLVRVVADRRDADGLQRRQFTRLENAQRIGWLFALL